MQEGVIEIFAFKWWHAAVLSGLSVEDEVDGKKRSTENGSTIKKALAHVALSYGIVSSLLVAAAESLSELGDILCCRNGRRFGTEILAQKLLPERGVVECAEGDGLRGFRDNLSQRCSHGEGPPQEERHCEVRRDDGGRDLDVGDEDMVASKRD